MRRRKSEWTFLVFQKGFFEKLFVRKKVCSEKGVSEKDFPAKSCSEKGFSRKMFLSIGVFEKMVSVEKGF